MSEEVIAAARSFVSGLFAQEYSGHDASHTFRVARTAERLAREEGADVDTVILAALLHDVDDRKLSPQTSAGKLRAAAFLREQGIEQPRIDRILTIIDEVAFRGTDSVVPSTLEGRCVQDADRLDAIGAMGIARAFAFGGSRNRAMYDPEVKPKLCMDDAQYAASESTTINHFYEKLLLLKDMMTTPTARKIAGERDRYMREFLSEFFAEWAGER